MKCTEEMYEAFKEVFYNTANGNETMRDLTMNALEAALALKPKLNTKLVGRYIEPGPNFKGAERVPSIRSYEEYSKKSVSETNGYWLEGQKVYVFE